MLGCHSSKHAKCLYLLTISFPRLVYYIEIKSEQHMDYFIIYFPYCYWKLFYRRGIQDKEAL